MECLSSVFDWGSDDTVIVSADAGETIDVDMSRMLTTIDNPLSPEGLSVSDSARETISARLERVGFGWIAEASNREERLARLRAYPSVRNLEESSEIAGTPLFMAPEVIYPDRF